MHYRIINTIKDNISYLRELHGIFAADTATDHTGRLEMCQNTAVDIGTSIENFHNPDSEIIPKLEEYCENVFQYSQTGNSLYLEKMCSIIEEVSLLVDDIRGQYRVVFLPYKADMWDSLESIWMEFKNDERFVCDVVPIPYFEANRDTKKWEARYDGERFSSEVPVIPFNRYSISDLKPDIAFIHNPFDNCNYITSVHPDYYSWELKKHVGKLVYVPYYANTGFISSDYLDLPSMKYIDYMIVQSSRAKETCKGYDCYEKVIPLGSPKFDKVINRCKKEISIPYGFKGIEGKKLLMLNTTVNEVLSSEDAILDKLHKYFELIKDNKDLKIVWRPHPLIPATIKAMRPGLADKYVELVSYFRNNDIGIFDTSADIASVIAVVDGYIGSNYSSVISLFHVAHKPIFVLDRKIRTGASEGRKKNAADYVKRTNEFDYLTCRENDDYTFYDFIDDLVNDRLGELMKLLDEEAENIAANLDGTCGKKVHEFLLKEMNI